MADWFPSSFSPLFRQTPPQSRSQSGFVPPPSSSSAPPPPAAASVCDSEEILQRFCCIESWVSETLSSKRCRLHVSIVSHCVRFTFFWHKKFNGVHILWSNVLCKLGKSRLLLMKNVFSALGCFFIYISKGKKNTSLCSSLSPLGSSRSQRSSLVKWTYREQSFRKNESKGSCFSVWRLFQKHFHMDGVLNHYSHQS